MTFISHFLNLILQGFGLFYSSRDKASEYGVGHKSRWLNSKQPLSATVLSSLKMQVLSSKSSVCDRVSPLIVSALRLGSFNCDRRHPLCLRNHTAQSQWQLTVILQHWAEPLDPLPSLHLVTADSRVDKLIRMEETCLRYESSQTAELRRCFYVRSLAFLLCTFKLAINSDRVSIEGLFVTAFYQLS